ncbi:hypothetical protein AYO40_06430 [Planctomycetaceae bacterium SCGC AG-212-D15]|nr:hypothetical protein AYO40_06430 [Planctomycetaceae bacterium SCGC AG-212-D15]
MACPMCGETNVTGVDDGHDVYACGFSSDGTTVRTACQGGRPSCVCATRDLMTNGCRCGAFQKEQAAKASGDPDSSSGGTGTAPADDPMLFR